MRHYNVVRTFLWLACWMLLAACSPIVKSTTGVNAFAYDTRFGAPWQQFNEIQQTLGLNHVRVLVNWNDTVQATPTSPLNFALYDQILQSLPSGMDALVIVNGLPSWMSDSANWINGDPRATFIQKWFKPVVARYSAYGRVVAWEVWNEPNDDGNPENITLATNISNPQGAQNYVAMLQQAWQIAKAATPVKLVVSAATTSINQNYPNTLNYNKAMVAAGAQGYCDIYGVHYYGHEYDHIFAPNGIQSFVNSLTLPIWLTESGAQGVDNQLSYVNETWTILKDAFKNLERIYYYQFAEDTPPDSTYGLRNLGPGQEYSDLYEYLAKH